MQRLEKELRVYDLLDRLNIPYTRVDHEAAMTMEICAGIENSLGAKICKNLLLCNRQQTDFYLLMLPGDKPFKTSMLSKQNGSFSTVEELLNVDGICKKRLEEIWDLITIGGKS